MANKERKIGKAGRRWRLGFASLALGMGLRGCAPSDVNRETPSIPTPITREFPPILTPEPEIILLPTMLPPGTLPETGAEAIDSYFDFYQQRADASGVNLEITNDIKSFLDQADQEAVDDVLVNWDSLLQAVKDSGKEGGVIQTMIVNDKLFSYYEQEEADYTYKAIYSEENSNAIIGFKLVPIPLLPETGAEIAPIVETTKLFPAPPLEVFPTLESEFTQQTEDNKNETKETFTGDPYFYIKVRQGDSLWYYHVMYGVTMEKLYEAMEGVVGSRNVKELPVGAILLIEAKPTRAPFARLQIPDINSNVPGEDTLFIEPLYQMVNISGWKEPNHTNAWMLAGFPNVIFLHRSSGLGRRISSLTQGDEFTLYRNIDFTDSMTAKVIKTEIINADEENNIFSQAKDSSFALVTCHPPEDATAPQRLVVWFRLD